MSGDRNFASAYNNIKMLDDSINNESSSVSASTSNNEESLDSCTNERNVLVVGNSSKLTPLPASSVLGSDEDSSNKTLHVNNAFSLGVVGNKCSGQRKIGSTTNENRPIFSISFRNQDIARKYKAPIKKFLKELIVNHEPDVEEYDTSDMELDVWEEESEDSQDEDIIIEDSSLFQVDTRPTLKDDLAVPTYSQKFSEILQKTEDGSAEADKSEDAFASRTSCFNCLGKHSLRDCPLPRDPGTINKNRRQFTNRYGLTPNKTSRYHLDDEQRFSHFVPGQISNKLRKALGINKHELPRYIYRMRLLGYPPGWIEEAKVSHSGLALYDSQGKEVADPDTEEGEILTEGSKDKYDINKIISFPGFNVPCSPGIIDDFEYHHCPPMTSEQSKELMLLQLSQNSAQAYKRRRLSTKPPADVNKSVDQDLTQEDMEVEDTPLNLLPADDDCRFIPPLPKDTPPRPPPPPSESDSEGGENHSQGGASPLSTGQSGMSSPRAQSPSLSDLETRKQLLLAELEDGGSSSDTTPKVATPSTPGPNISTLGKIKSVDLGTPILKSASPYTCLPSPEKFSQNICDVMNFENLPDSTGKYEKMSDIIRKVRTVVSQINNEDDHNKNEIGLK